MKTFFLILVAAVFLIIACTKSGNKPPVQSPPVDTSVIKPPVTTDTTKHDTSIVSSPDTTTKDSVKSGFFNSSLLILKSDTSWADFTVLNATQGAEYSSDFGNALYARLVSPHAIVWALDSSSINSADKEFSAAIPASDLAPVSETAFTDDDTARYVFIEVGRFDKAKHPFAYERFYMSQAARMHLRIIQTNTMTLSDADAKMLFNVIGMGEVSNTY